MKIIAETDGVVAGANVFAVGKTNERCDGRRACFAEEIADGDLARRVQSTENFLKSIKDIRVVEITIKRPCGSSRLKCLGQKMKSGGGPARPRLHRNP